MAIKNHENTQILWNYMKKPPKNCEHIYYYETLMQLAMNCVKCNCKI